MGRKLDISWIKNFDSFSGQLFKFEIMPKVDGHDRGHGSKWTPLDGRSGLNWAVPTTEIRGSYFKLETKTNFS